jgi:hypothetical protein
MLLFFVAKIFRILAFLDLMETIINGDSSAC